MNQYHSYCDNSTDIDWISTFSDMSTTIDALNANIILLNKFIESALNIIDNTYFKENVEIRTFDASGNTMTCVKTDGSGNFIPCVFMDLSANIANQHSFSAFTPSYHPHYSRMLDDNAHMNTISPHPIHPPMPRPILPPMPNPNVSPIMHPNVSTCHHSDTSELIANPEIYGDYYSPYHRGYNNPYYRRYNNPYYRPYYSPYYQPIYPYSNSHHSPKHQ